MPQTILRLPAVMSYSGLSRSSVYARIVQGLWTKPVNLGGRAVGWPENEVEAINNARIAGKSNEEILRLVTGLEESRHPIAILKMPSLTP
jgi:prophage regulatory protein